MTFLSIWDDKRPFDRLASSDVLVQRRSANLPMLESSVVEPTFGIGFALFREHQTTRAQSRRFFSYACWRTDATCMHMHSEVSKSQQKLKGLTKIHVTL